MSKKYPTGSWVC